MTATSNRGSWGALLALLVGIGVAGCGEEGPFAGKTEVITATAPESMPLASDDAAVSRAAGSPASPGQLRGTDLAAQPAAATTMIIRTGTARIEVDSLEIGISRVWQLAQRLGGYVANTSIQAGREQIRQATLEIKLPSARFDDAITGLAPIGRVEAVDTRAEDVGEEFVDVTARLENARRLEERYLRLLESRTAELQQVLSVERELARVREEIERYQGRLRYLQSRVALSTLTIALHEPLPVMGEAPGSSPIRDAVRQAWRNLIGFVAGFIALLGVLVPLGVLLAIAWWAVDRLGGFGRRGRSLRAPANSPAEPGAGPRTSPNRPGRA